MSFPELFRQIQSGAVSTILPDEELAKAQLDKVFVGKSRDKFSIVEISHSVVSVCSMFGSFVKFIVSITFDVEVVAFQTGSGSSKRQRLEDTAVMKSLPSGITNEKNRKDKLYNAIILFLGEQGLGWREPDKYGKPFVSDV